MNLTTTDNINIPLSGNLKRIVMQTLITAAGMVLAASAFVALVPQGTAKPATAVALPKAVSIGDSTTPTQYFYIVSNDAERSGLVNAIQESQMNSYDAHLPAFNSSVIVAGSDAEHILLTYGVADMDAYGTPYRIVRAGEIADNH